MLSNGTLIPSWLGVDLWDLCTPQGLLPDTTLMPWSSMLQAHINFPRFLPIFPGFLERLSHLAPIY
jgi:hypothetical protein